MPESGWYADPDGDPERLRYWDGQRWTDQYTRPRSKHYWVDEPQGPARPLGALLRLAIAGLVFAALAQVLHLVADLNRISLDQTFLDGGVISQSDIQRADDLDHAAKIGGYAGLIVGALCFIPWFHRAYSNLTRLGFRELRYGPGWAIGAWLIPIVNLFRPKQIANDIYRGSTPGIDARSQFWETQPISTLLSWWWGVYLGSGFLAGIGASAANADDARVTSAIQATQVIRNEKDGLVLTSIAWVVSIIAAILAINVVISLTRRQEEAIRLRERASVTV